MVNMKGYLTAPMCLYVFNKKSVYCFDYLYNHTPKQWEGLLDAISCTHKPPTPTQIPELLEVMFWGQKGSTQAGES